MKQTWRWFGPKDPVTLEKIAQAGATGIVSSLHHIQTGVAWPKEDVTSIKATIEQAGLTWDVIESIPVHNNIKLRSGNFEQQIENYRASIQAVGAVGINTVCYNFMPVVDWTRTSLNYRLKNNAQALRFDIADFAAYDLFILKRKNAQSSYSPDVLARAESIYRKMNTQAQEQLEQNIIAGLPGGEGSYTREAIRAIIQQFIDLGEAQFREHLMLFLESVVPVAEDAGVKLCIHPDDPPFSLFGLPRVVSTADDARLLLQRVPSPSNGLTLCAGSFGARGDNDLIAMVREFGPSIHFVHLRNVKRESDGSFYEADHLVGDTDMVGLVQALLDEQNRRQSEGREDALIPMRPDHGHLMADEQTQNNVNPGYSYVGRLKGLAELRGVMVALASLPR